MSRLSFHADRLFKRAAQIAGYSNSLNPDTGLDGEVPSFEIHLATVLEQTRKLVPGKTIIDVSLSLPDGRALPRWLEVSETRVLIIKTLEFGEIVLAMDLVYSDGDSGRFELTICAKTLPLKLRVKPVPLAQTAPLFSDQLSRDEQLPAFALALAA